MSETTQRSSALIATEGCPISRPKPFEVSSVTPRAPFDRLRVNAVSSQVVTTSQKTGHFFHFLRLHQQGGENGKERQESRDHEEVLEHRHTGVDQDGLGRLV